MWLTVLLLVLFCMPLSAGDRNPLEDAVGAFASDEFAVRQGATRAVREHLNKVLAPLLSAMKSEDPEVARRARGAIEGLLPSRREDPVASRAVGNANWGQMVQIIQAGNNRLRIVMNGPNGMFVVHNHGQKHVKRIKEFGLQGYPCSQALLRKQLGLAAGRGYVVQRVTRGSAARKIALLPHDIILAIDGLPVMQYDSFYKALGKQDTWLDRTIRVMRNGKVISLRGR